MSLLADLLSKIKQPQTKRDVPPNLKNIVQTSAQKSASRRRIILLSVLFAVSTITGIFLVYFTRTLSEKSVSNIGAPARERAELTERQIQNKEGNTSGQPEISKSAESVQPLKTKEPIQDIKVGKPEVVKPKKHEDVSQAAPGIGSRGKEILPNLEQVIVKKESPNKSLSEFELDTFLYSAREHEMKNEYQGALLNYKKVLETDKNNFVIMNNIAYIYLKLGLTEESVRYSQMAFEINKDYIPALINLGVASAKSENISAAEDYFNNALKLDPNNQNVILNLAVLYERQRDYPKAYNYFSRLAKSGDLSGTLGLARVYEKQDKAEEALKLYKSAYADNSLNDKTRSEVKQRIIVLSGKIQKSGN
jgi:tetratricopeptide (TPR) repeat protein